MAKNIKAIKCPNCGSIRKTVIKPDYYKCDSCETEYFLDSDDINVNVNYNHNYQGTSTTSVDPAKNKTALAILAGVIFVILLFSIQLLVPEKQEPDKVEKEAYDFSSVDDIVYTNSISGKPMFLRLAREFLRDENEHNDFVNTHVVIIDPVTKKQVKDEILFNKIRRLDNSSSTYRVTTDQSVYMIYKESKIFKVDRAANTLVEVTKTMFKNHPEISAGIANVSFDDDNLTIMTNEGNKFHYIIASDQLFNGDDWTSFRDAEAKLITDSYFSFNYSDKLSKMRPGQIKNQGELENFTPNRKYFDPEIIYQDKTTLLIATNINASEDAPTTLQSLDVQTGKILWVLPAKSMTYESSAKCKEGFAVQYSAGEEMDYISGMYVISPDGKILYDYQLTRNQ
ncbi:hypothetical protein LZQ00_03965 [Sphingobacterium sp. SRCM116780]|uniref:hypothetical protein n=1 Tax=Sphingobacterium sp. SRCM116780 TaxID=2907623 RepID=UPI001F3D503B|nr:hypothetical protein [Sphingobacterium sp. SRCM116780]UIR56977.1 hypothetical protein LZQ00_03965 [Sphingobacterium sp. SRCM116780]